MILDDAQHLPASIRPRADGHIRASCSCEPSAPAGSDDQAQRSDGAGLVAAGLRQRGMPTPTGVYVISTMPRRSASGLVFWNRLNVIARPAAAG
jgi:hypothetical protein